MSAHQDEPFFITEAIEAEMIAAGYVFEPPAHVSTVRLHEILVGLSDAELYGIQENEAVVEAIASHSAKVE